MDYIELTENNIDKEHICCALIDKKGCCGAAKKREWLKQRLNEGLVFRKADVRGKVFIEYIPAEKAWIPVNAENYLLIDCLWVSGSYKGKGYGRELLQSCIDDARSQGKYGVVGLSSVKKKGFLSDPSFFEKNGFEIVDSADPYFRLYCLRFDSSYPIPSFKECAKKGTIDDTENIVIYYTNQCPFTEDNVRDVKEYADEHGIPLRVVRYENTEMAQNAPVPATTYSLFKNGVFVTHEVQNVAKFLKILGK
ncbi:GNAT family N-acetyltransferase [Ruminococcus flavefaciens]|jgi:GNAT superfamily N-acetyltransferase|uniref:GNAT family N-acetyltransferase n=1 Tax=Ruminococcus flavefaciens TaxID=1265 RepID=UPI00156FC761|nr:GNAT family N-acetyltransferase [Ruminococcus flavefaciens]